FRNDQIAKITGYGDYQREMLIFLGFTSEYLGKLKPKADTRIFISYAPAKKAFPIYNKRTCLITETIHVDFDKLTAASEQFSLGPRHQLLTPGTINSGLVPNPPSPTPYVPPTKDLDNLFQSMFDEYFSPPPSVASLDLDILFQAMFDEYFSLPPSVASLVPAVIASVPADLIGSTSSTLVDKDAPSLSTSQTPPESQSLDASPVPTFVALVLANLIGLPSSNLVDQDAPSLSTSQTPQDSLSPVASPGVVEEFHDIEVAYLDNDPFFGVPILEPNSKESSSRDVIPTSVHSVNQPPEYLSKWARIIHWIMSLAILKTCLYNQLQNKSLFCYFDAFLSFVEQKNYKESLKEACWSEAMQEELNEFQRLKLWELVPRPDRVMIITLKWTFKVKLDEMGGVLKTKARSYTLECAKVYYECKEPFKSLKSLWVRSKSIAATWLEKVVTPLIEPAIKGFAAASAVLKSERLKVDRNGMSEPMSYYLID
nr:hypothetical protein [Tanacetum cinerariifolium]